MKALRYSAVALMMTFLLVGCGTTKGDPVAGLGEIQRESTPTAYTTRLAAGNPEKQAIVLTQAVYPATRETNGAGAIIVVRQHAAEAFTAMHRVTHMPVNAPLLYLDRYGRLSAETLQEMRRLRPEGVMQDGNVQVYVIGKISPSVTDTIEQKLGYKVRAISAEDPVALAEALDNWQAAVKADHPDEVVISALDHPEGIKHGLGAMGWNAHRGAGFGWVYRNSVPDETRQMLQRRHGDAYIYLTGGSDVISNDVARELSQYGPVRRIQGSDVFETSTVNAGYKDIGRNFGWWWGWQARNFGWGINQSGHNFIVASADDVLGAIPAAVLGHMGKHGPMLLVQHSTVPPAVSDYLDRVRPTPSGPTETILNHAWIIGDESRISWDVQRRVDRLLRPGQPAS